VPTADERAAENEALWREVNENVEAEAGRLDVPPETRARFVCECGNDGCTVVIEVPLLVYEWVRANPRRFIVLPAHVAREVEHVVERAAGYAIVEKDTPDSIRIVEERDPRA